MKAQLDNLTSDLYKWISDVLENSVEGVSCPDNKQYTLLILSGHETPSTEFSNATVIMDNPGTHVRIMHQSQKWPNAASNEKLCFRCPVPILYKESLGVRLLKHTKLDCPSICLWVSALHVCTTSQSCLMYNINHIILMYTVQHASTICKHQYK